MLCIVVSKEDTSMDKGPLTARGVEARPYDMIRQDIIDGRLASGARLKVSELAGIYGTSTIPVREALHRLHGEGFVVITHNQGASVRKIDVGYLANTFDILAMLEAYMIRGFVQYAGDEQLGELERCVVAIETNNFESLEKHRELDARLHEFTYEGHGNQQALEIWNQKRNVLSIRSNMFAIGRERRATILREHREILEAARMRDPDVAAEVVERHVRGSAQALIDSYRAGAHG